MTADASPNGAPCGACPADGSRAQARQRDRGHRDRSAAESQRDHAGHGHADDGHADDGHAGHGHGLATSSRRLLLALVVTAGFLVVEVTGGIVFNSLALLSDSVHMLTDVAALTFALVAQWVAERPRTAERTYGYRRAETLAAFVNGIALGVGAVWIIAEATHRWYDQHPVVGEGMLIVAVLGLVANLVCAWILSRGHDHNLNTRAALFHVLSDAAGSVGAIIAGIVVIASGWERADTLVSFLLAGLILFGAWRLVRSAVDVLMEGAPRETLVHDLERTIRETPGVAAVHDLHAWTISDGFPVITAHVVLDGSREGCRVSLDVGARLLAEHGIAHATIQPEPAEGQAANQRTAATTAT